MTDHHVHIGQFNEVYYDAHEVFEAIEESGATFGIDEVRFSSTSSCRDDVELSKIEEETEYALLYSGKLKVKPYLWFVPRYAEKGISVFSAVKSFDYCGIKLHPFAQRWDFDNFVHRKCLEEIFAWADEKEKSVLIHCGSQECDFPARFEQFFGGFKKSHTILAHSNPVDATAMLVNSYPHVFCDTAYVKSENLKKLLECVREHKKILFGTDFPITAYFEKQLFGRDICLTEEYMNDCVLANLKIRL